MHKYFLQFKGSLVLFCLTGVLKAAAAIFLAYFFQKTIDAASALDADSLVPLLGLGILLVIALSCSETLYGLAQARLLRKCNYSLKNEIFHTILRSDINTFSESNSSRYVSILNNDVRQIETNYFQNVCTMISAAITFLFAVISMWTINPYATLFALALNLLPLLPPVLFSRRLRKAQKDLSESQETYNSGIKDVFMGFEIVKSFNAEGHAEHNFSLLNGDVERNSFHQRKMVAYSNGGVVLFGEVTFISVTLFLLWLAATAQITVGSALAGIQLTNYFVNPFQQISMGFTNLKSVRAVENRIVDILNISEESEQTRSVLKNAAPIVLDNVTFGYKPEKTVLSNFTFTFEEGKKYAIVGASGCGKSTLIKLLMQYYPDYTGNISFGGQNAGKIDHASLYRKVALIHQNIVMFDDTLKNNITLFEEFPEDVIRQASKDAGLENFLGTLPDGFSTHIEENGRNLSGGEKQRIAIARAFVRNASVLILDEATSSLDNENTYQIENAVLCRKNITALVITHKLSDKLLKRYDEILAIRNGRIEEHGIFNDLMARNGYFCSLYNLSKL